TATARMALSIYRGELLPQDRYEEWVDAARNHLADLHLQLLRLAERWEELVVLDPSDEDAHLEVMRRHLAGGDRHAALRQFERLDRALRNELGVAPSDEAKRLRARALADEPAPPVHRDDAEAPFPGRERYVALIDELLDDAERFDASRARDALSDTSDARADDAADHLPPSPDEVLGRETDLGTLLEWLGGDDPRRLVTLVGPGGIGKTRLAIEAARLARDRFDRVTFVALEHVREPGGVLPAVALELGVRDDIGVPTLERLALARTGRRDLLVLDNFEQVIGDAPDVASLLAALPDAAVMVTSRARLRVHAEQVFDVEPLALPIDPREVSLAEIADAPAVRLFLDRAHAADSRFDLTAENAADVAGICRALDGVPLAIELAAACIRVLTPSAMLAKLDRVLSLLVTSGRDVPERQRTIRATVEWSIDLLSPFARALFVRLGVFTGDFSLDAVEAVADGEPWAVDLLGTLLELVDGSLLRQRDVGGTPFFSMLAPVRELAALRFAHEMDDALVRHAHAAYYVRLASEVEPMLHGSTQQPAVERLAAERDNVRAGYLYLMAVGEVDTVADAVWRLRLYWRIRNLLPTAKAWMDDLLQAGGPLSPRTRAIAITLSSWVSLSQPGTPVDPEPLEEAVELFRDAGDRFGEGAALAVLGVACATSSTPDLDRAEELQRRALDLVTPDVDPTFNAVFRGQLGSIEFLRGRARDALAIYDGVIEDAVRMGNRFVEMIELTNAGWARLALGEARPELFARHLELTLRLGNEDGVGNAVEGLAACAIVLGDLDQAGVLLGAVDMLRTRTGRFDQRTYPTSGPIVERVLASEGAAEFEAGRARGRAMSRRDALRFAHEYARAFAKPVAAGAGARADAPGSGSPEHPQIDF
ncbi:BTAD domain-containing putative transcriptional regulator, partial [Agromyces sp. Soil535]|uniref:ATP-binding protein n=1 Tax=Agromyces sp. Soil535 TaxID=1736390 RepID=UPI0006FAB869